MCKKKKIYIVVVIIIIIMYIRGEREREWERGEAQDNVQGDEDGGGEKKEI